MRTAWLWAADAVVLAHFAFLLYLLVGGFLAWRWPRTIVAHALTAVWAVLMVTTPVQCPLTWMQNEFRRHAGQGRLASGFIETYVTGTFYPTSAETLVQVATGAVVLVSWIGFARRLHARHADANGSRQPADRST